MGVCVSLCVYVVVAGRYAAMKQSKQQFVKIRKEQIEKSSVAVG